MKCPRCNGNGYIMEDIFRVPCLLCMGDGTIDAKPNPLHHAGVLVMNEYQKAAWRYYGFNL